MASNAFRNTPVIFWPVVAVWKIITKLVELTGILIALLVGFIFMVVGVTLSMTVVGAVIGIPLLFIGVMITLRAIY